MLTLIEHPEHGRTHVYTPLELEQHIARGWRPVGENKPVEPIAPKKRGPKPKAKKE